MKITKLSIILSLTLILSLIFSGCNYFVDSGRVKLGDNPTDFLAAIKAANSYTATMQMSGEDDIILFAANNNNYKTVEDEQETYYEIDGEQYFVYTMQGSTWQKELVDAFNFESFALLNVNSNILDQIFNSNNYTYLESDNFFKLNNGTEIIIFDDVMITDAEIYVRLNKIVLLLSAQIPNLNDDDFLTVDVRIEYKQLNNTQITLPTIQTQPPEEEGEQP